MLAFTRISLARNLILLPRSFIRIRPDLNSNSSRFPHDRVKGNTSPGTASRAVTAILHMAVRDYSQNMSTSGGLFHEAALRGDVDEFEQLVKSGMDPNSPNSGGRLPLHTFCGAPWIHDEFLLDDQVPRPATNWFLEHTNNIDTPDRDGITALHIASMMSQYLVKTLLVAGADPTRTTCDGMNALHLAARARQSNIVGILIDALTTRHGNLQEHEVNAKDDTARTPLHYACRSGRPETVSYMIAAGADPTSMDVNGLTPLDACLEFEDEQTLWADYRELQLPDWYWLGRVDLPSDWGTHALGGVRKQDDDRPWIRPSRELQRALDRLPGGPWREDTFRIASVQHTARLEEILNAITKALRDQGKGTQAVQDHITKCIKHCEIKGLEYTKSCFVGLRGHLSTNHQRLEKSVQRTQSDLEQRFGKRHDQPGDHAHLALVETLLRRRKYGVLENILRDDGSSLPLLDSDVYDIARLLVRHGFAKLLRTIIDSKHGSQLRSEPSASPTSGDPLLIVAVKRQLPNMDVVRLLIEKLQVDINCRSRTGEEAYADVDAPGVCYDFDVRQPGLNTALYECAKGFNWWQVKCCLPYLLSRGADVNLENEAGLAPWQITQADYQETFMEDSEKLVRSTSQKS
ncbi:hypothetical protein HBI60_081110 [Parastagonospora nodorum]|nr:hypothetical protein HBI60_081110 [Parastagonospora nodorum]